MDQQSDFTHKTLYNILQERPGIEPLIKEASVGRALEYLPSSSFADTYNRAFPIDTPANAAMSLAYATKTADLAPHVSRNLARAAEVYGIMLPPKAQVKVAQEEPRYLLPKQKKFGIKTASDVPKAEAALKRVSTKLSTEDLAVAASVLVKAAADSNQNVSPVVMQWAGLAQCDLEKAADWIEAREDCLSGKAKGAFLKVASVVREFDETNTRDDLVKIAETVDKLDTLYGLPIHYNRKLPNPMETVFNTKTSMAKMVTLAGTDVALSDLMKKDPSFYGDVLGDDIVSEITTDGKLDETKLVEELPILPADMLKLLLSKMGVTPKAEKQEKTANPVGFLKALRTLAKSPVAATAAVGAPAALASALTYAASGESDEEKNQRFRMLKALQQQENQINYLRGLAGMESAGTSQQFKDLLDRRTAQSLLEKEIESQY